MGARRKTPTTTATPAARIAASSTAASVAALAAPADEHQQPVGDDAVGRDVDRVGGRGVGLELEHPLLDEEEDVADDPAGEPGHDQQPPRPASGHVADQPHEGDDDAEQSDGGVRRLAGQAGGQQRVAGEQRPQRRRHHDRPPRNGHLVMVRRNPAARGASRNAWGWPQWAYEPVSTLTSTSASGVQLGGQWRISPGGSPVTSEPSQGIVEDISGDRALAAVSLTAESSALSTTSSVVDVWISSRVTPTLPRRSSV